RVHTFQGQIQVFQKQGKEQDSDYLFGGKIGECGLEIQDARHKAVNSQQPTGHSRLKIYSHFSFSQYSILNAQYSILNTQCSIPIPIPTTHYPTPTIFPQTLSLLTNIPEICTFFSPVKPKTIMTQD